MSISVKNITVNIDNTSSNGFYIELSGSKWKLDNFSLRQSLLSYNILTFSMHKEPTESVDDSKFNVFKQLIGKDINLSLDTENIENLSFKTNNEKTDEIKFRGIILSASGSRKNSTYTINIEARSHEALLDDNPSCKSYEEMTLGDIINDVTEEYSQDIDAVVNPRFTEPIAYCVQYNETDYQFMLRLAQRYGEWLYNDGEQFIFGQLKEQASVRLKYPSQDIPDYNVDLRTSHVAFDHVTSSYNAYDSTLKDGLNEMLRPYNELGDSIFDASVERYTKRTLQNLHSGGFADQDGRDTILNVSTKTQARGEKAHMLIYSGRTYCSKLKIGSTLVIVDNFITNEKTNAKSDVDQDEILITELVHTFSANETYSNRFTGIPAACDYPPYFKTDVYPTASSCRAKVMDNEDPMDLGRIRVQFDWQAQLDESMMTPWLRIAQPYAGGGKGFSFIPEIGEEVMIDFEGGNAERPYVKGTLYNGVGNPDALWLPGNNSHNQIKAIRTRNGHTIEIHDEGEDGYIRIYDNEKENYILTFSTDRKLIMLESTGNIELYAKNDIIMHAGHDIVAEADHDISETAHNDMFLAADNDMQRTADNDIREHAGHDRTASIDHNDSLSVSENQFVTIGDNKDEQVEHKLQITAENIREEAKQKLMEYSQTHHAKAEQEMALNAGMKIDIKAMIVKTN